jgi:phenylacetate-CoA ligase
MDTDWFVSNVNLIIEFEPEYVIAYTGGFMRLLAFYEMYSYMLPQSIKYIEFIGEPLMDYQVQVLKTFTNAQVIMNYSCTEVLGLAVSCRQGHMHCIGKNAVIEIMQNGSLCSYGQEGDIVLTSKFSKAMPFIRYQIGDIGLLRKGSDCSCGNSNDILEITKGRSVDYIELYNGERIHSIVLCSIIEHISFIMKNCIFRFQIKQVSDSQIDIYLSFRDGFDLLLPAFKKQFLTKVKYVINADILWDFHVISMVELLDPMKTTHFQKERR